jgi:NAD(P)-dependent dehydrogenase (short-subunit alcohol dehydrogenase family)
MGVGAAIVATLASEGAGVFTAARSRPDDLDDGIGFIAADISGPEGVVAVAEAAWLGAIDGIVRVVSVAPGFVRTGAAEALIQRIAGRLGGDR